MGNDYVIYTDASADIDVDFVQKNDIRFVPMRYTIGEEERLCTSLESDDFLKKFYAAQKEGKVTQTSQITPYAYVEEFEPWLQKGISVLYFSLSSGLSKTYDSVCLAASQLAEEYTDAKVVPVDTLAATGGMGLLIEKAVENKNKGMDIDQNARWLEDNRLNIELCFLVDDLMYLKRGGRIPATTAVLGMALNIKPILKIDAEGRLITVEKKRGTKTALKYIANKYQEIRMEEYGNRVYIVHGDDEETASQLEAMIKEINPEADITKMMLCPVIGSHTGPGMVAAIYFGKR